MRVHECAQKLHTLYLSFPLLRFALTPSWRGGGGMVVVAMEGEVMGAEVEVVVDAMKGDQLV